MLLFHLHSLCKESVQHIDIPNKASQVAQQQLSPHGPQIKAGIGRVADMLVDARGDETMAGKLLVGNLMTKAGTSIHHGPRPQILAQSNANQSYPS